MSVGFLVGFRRSPYAEEAYRAAGIARLFRMPVRSPVLRPRWATVATGDGAAVVGAIACVLAAAILYLCFAALALLDDGDREVGCAPSPPAIAAFRSPR